MAIIALLASILLPSLKNARMRTRIIKAHHDLRQITLALDAYALNNKDKFPPTRAGCSEEICFQLPIELAKKKYLPRKPGRILQADMDDEFNPDNTYKYRAPGLLLVNQGSYAIENGSQIWIPDDYPNCDSEEGKLYSDPKISLVRYATWSMGPDPKSPKFPRTSTFSGTMQIDQWDFPLRKKYWCLRAGDSGLITHSKDRNGLIYMSP